MEAAAVMIALIMAWAVTGLAMFLADMVMVVFAVIVVRLDQSPKQTAIRLLTMGIESAASGPLYLILRTSWFQKTK